MTLNELLQTLYVRAREEILQDHRCNNVEHMFLVGRNHGAYAMLELMMEAIPDEISRSIHLPPDLLSRISDVAVDDGEEENDGTH